VGNRERAAIRSPDRREDLNGLLVLELEIVVQPGNRGERRSRASKPVADGGGGRNRVERSRAVALAQGFKPLHGLLKRVGEFLRLDVKEAALLSLRSPPSEKGDFAGSEKQHRRNGEVRPLRAGAAIQRIGVAGSLEDGRARLHPERDAEGRTSDSACGGGDGNILDRRAFLEFCVEGVAARN